jgi:hypothetical protein
MSGVGFLPGLPTLPTTPAIPQELIQNPRVQQVLAIAQQLPADQETLLKIREQIEREVPDCIDPKVQSDAQAALNYLFTYDYRKDGPPGSGNARLDQLVMFFRTLDPVMRQQLLLVAAALNQIQQNYPTCGDSNLMPIAMGVAAGLALGLFVGIVVK